MLKKIRIITVISLAILGASCKNENKADEANSNVQQAQPVINGSGKTTSEDFQNQSIKFPKPVDGKYPVITFKETEFDFGDIEQGDKVEHTFEFTNTGEANLIIADAKASCGCTVPEYPKNEYIKPGDTGKIKVTFDSARKVGKTSKTITIICNTEKGTELLTIKTTIKVAG
ncbi:MAG: hypothetical protein DCF13_01945 [Flavobacteriaceae bacterium]|jgi:hypothetical protein|nr:MAG: hypothetical protein DCF13_01945 [Flavobacteriaceae bacterium]